MIKKVLSGVISGVISNVVGGSAWATSDYHGIPQDVWTSSWYTSSTASAKITGFGVGDIVTLNIDAYRANADTTLVTVSGGTTDQQDIGGISLDNPAAPSQFVVEADSSGEVLITVTGGVIGGNYGALSNLSFSAVAGGPSLSEPSTITGDGVYAGVGAQLSTTATTIRHEFSRDGFTTIHGFKEYPVTLATSTSFSVDVTQGYEESIADKQKHDLAFCDDANWSSRWVYKDFEDEDVVFNFTNNPQSGYSVYPAAKSDYNGQSDSMIHQAQSDMGEYDQLYLKDSLLNGVPTPLSTDFADANHPLPNYFGGDSETYDGPAEFAIGTEGDMQARALTGAIVSD